MRGRVMQRSSASGICGVELLLHTRGCLCVIDRDIRVCAKLCQSIMKVAPCQRQASQHISRVGMAGGTCKVREESTAH